MKYLVDTNVISELVSIKPNKNVVTWFQQIPINAIFLSVLTLGEIRKGIEKVMVLVTRNVEDFSDCNGLEIMNPWEDY